MVLLRNRLREEPTLLQSLGRSQAPPVAVFNTEATPLPAVALFDEHCSASLWMSMPWHELTKENHAFFRDRYDQRDEISLRLHPWLGKPKAFCYRKLFSVRIELILNRGLPCWLSGGNKCFYESVSSYLHPSMLVWIHRSGGETKCLLTNICTWNGEFEVAQIK